MPIIIFCLDFNAVFQWEMTTRLPKTVSPLRKAKLPNGVSTLSLTPSSSSSQTSVVILFNMVTRSVGYCSISAYLSSRATVLLNHILVSFIIPSTAHVTRKHMPPLPSPFLYYFYYLSCITGLFCHSSLYYMLNSHAFDIFHWIRKIGLMRKLQILLLANVSNESQ